MNVRATFWGGLILFLAAGLQAEMQICEFLPEQVETSLFSVEPLAFEGLRKKPLDQDVTCLVAPCYRLARLPLKSWPKGLPKRSTGTTFTICSYAHYSTLLSVMKRLGVTHIFACNPRNDIPSQGIKLIPILHAPRNAAGPAADKDILYSFVGCLHTSVNRVKVRHDMVRLPKWFDVVIKWRSRWNPQGEAEINEYIDINSRSRFGLCPRGTFLNTIRFPELLKAGAIPVVLADGWRLPAGIDWKKCAIFVKERDALKVDKIIRSISPDVEEAMRKECLRVSALLEDDPAYFIRYYFNQRLSSK